MVQSNTCYCSLFIL